MSARALVLLCLVASAAAIPTIHIEVNVEDSGADVPPAPTPKPGSCTMATEATCSDAKCCNWCTPPNGTLGFCMTMIPYPLPGFECEKDVSACKTHTSAKKCGEMGECSWVPIGPKGSEAGLCVFDWDRCKAPPSSFVPSSDSDSDSEDDKPKPAPPAPKPPKPTMGCNGTTAEECDANSCCQWCGTMFNTTAPGFCMPVLDIPIPTMQCSKGSTSCADMLTEEDCDKDSVCSWTPFGPPGPTSTAGVCFFDWDKCKK